MYHSIENEPESGMNTHPQKFESQIRRLKKMGFTFLCASDLLKAIPYKSVFITFDDGFENNFTYAFQTLKKYNARATIYIAPNIENIKKLTDEQVKEMLSSGLVEIGAHSNTHVNLAELDEHSARNEIFTSKKIIETKYGIQCNSFAYPFGRFNAAVTKIIKEGKFKTALTTKKKIFNPEKDDPFLIPRISIHGKITRFQFYIAISRGRYKF